VRVYRLEVMVIDSDALGESGIKQELENVSFPNDCLRLRLVSAESREVDWNDNHPLNMCTSWRGTFLKLFASPDERKLP